jgi:hypothetical protein
MVRGSNSVYTGPTCIDALDHHLPWLHVAATVIFLQRQACRYPTVLTESCQDLAYSCWQIKENGCSAGLHPAHGCYVNNIEQQARTGRSDRAEVVFNVTIH